jgi:DGQHR domain-containing protein
VTAVPLTKTSRLAGALCVQRGVAMLQTYADAPLITRQGRIDIHDPKTDAGYQRKLVTARTKQTADYYQGGGLMPNPLLINIRDEDFASGVTLVVDGGKDSEAAYENAVENGGNWVGTGYIEIEPDVVLWVYDGQHRRAGLRRLVDSQAGFDEFPTPVSITLGLTTRAEMNEFYQVNTNAKSVSTSLAYTLLAQLAQTDPALHEALVIGEKDWITRGQSVMEELEKLAGPWTGRFQPANTRKRVGDGMIMPMPMFVRSLKPVLDMPLLKQASDETVAKILNAYWLGIAEVLPEAFDGQPEDYVIQKGQGVVALHRVLPQVVEVVRANGASLGDSTAYAEAMAALPALSGYAVVDGEQSVVDGAEFWRVGSSASGFSGDAGRRRLGQLIQALLPKPSDSIKL